MALKNQKALQLQVSYYNLIIYKYSIYYVLKFYQSD